MFVCPIRGRCGSELGGVKRLAPFVTAALVLVGALVHIKLYFDGYRSVPNANLGRSFLLNGAAGTVLAAALVSIGSASRLGRLTRAATAGWAAASLVALAMSRTDSGVFGFTETGWNPSPETAIAVITQTAALILAVIALVTERGESDSARLDVRRTIVAGAAAAVVTLGLGAIWANGDDSAADASPAAATTEPATDATPTVEPETTAPATAAPRDVAVDIADFAFSPKDLTIRAGDSVTWTNRDSFAHSTRTDDASFDSPNLAQGDSYSHTFDATGTFTYVCGIHNSMTATVIVEAA